MEPEQKSIASQQFTKHMFPQQQREQKSIASQRLANTHFSNNE
jgi:hypothetical protein